MQKLNAKARFNITEDNLWKLKEKQKVYFCCHPDDFKLYFEILSDEILKEVDCAIWYQQEEDKLSSMVLFVVPITHNLLLKKSQADEEIKYAFKNKYAVLPIVVEPNIDLKLYEKIFGTAQYLDKIKREDTGKTYEEKFKNFLNSVLIGDELAEKVRKAFDAYIFLSYRKKDRKYAEELMHLIHENEFCRDIAIWYDEDLIPGEAFDQAIENAMKKSQLFALAVTPNLINEINYVRTTEYPLAIKNNMPILPAELVETDKKQLSKQYENIPDCVNPRDKNDLEKVLKKTLLDKLVSMATTSNDTDPEHNYLIGLAYLNGIDVERDNKKALELITFAANNNLPVAVEKLVNMYKNAEGVERNFDTAIKWQGKLCEIYKNKLENEESEYNRIIYFNALWDYADEYKNINQYEESEKIYYNLLIFAIKYSSVYNSNESIRCLSTCYNKLGDLNIKKGDLRKALDFYEKSLDISEQLANYPGSIENLRDLEIDYDRMGYINKVLGDINKSLIFYKKSLEIAENVIKEQETIENKRDLAVSYNKIADIYLQEGKFNEAINYFLKDLEISQQLEKETKTFKSMRDLAITYFRLGDVYKELGNLEIAVDYYKKSTELREKIVNEERTIQSKDDLSINYLKIGEIYISLNKLDISLEYLNIGLNIIEEIVDSINSFEVRRNLLVVNINIGTIHAYKGNLKEAKYYFEKGVEISENLLKENETPKSKRDLYVILMNLGGICENEGDLDGALIYYNKGLSLSEKIVEEVETEDAYKDLYVCYRKIANIYKIKGDSKKEDFYMLFAIKIYDMFNNY